MKTFNHDGQSQSITREAVSRTMYGNGWKAADVATWDAAAVCSELLDQGFFDFAGDGEQWAGPVTDEMRAALLQCVSDVIDAARKEG